MSLSVFPADDLAPAVPSRAANTTAGDHLTDVVHARLVELTERGVPFGLACNAAGVTAESGDAWLRAGRIQPTGPEARLVREILRARADYAMQAIQNIESKGRSEDWRATAWLLERLYGEDFGTKQRVEHTGADGGPINTTQIVLYQLPDNGRDVAGGSDTPVAGSLRDHSDRLGLPRSRSAVEIISASHTTTSDSRNGEFSPNSAPTCSTTSTSGPVAFVPLGNQSHTSTSNGHAP